MKTRKAKAKVSSRKKASRLSEDGSESESERLPTSKIGYVHFPINLDDTFNFFHRLFYQASRISKVPEVAVVELTEAATFAFRAQIFNALIQAVTTVHLKSFLDAMAAHAGKNFRNPDGTEVMIPTVSKRWTRDMILRFSVQGLRENVLNTTKGAPGAPRKTVLHEKVRRFWKREFQRHLSSGKLARDARGMANRVTRDEFLDAKGKPMTLRHLQRINQATD